MNEILDGALARGAADGPSHEGGSIINISSILGLRVARQLPDVFNQLFTGGHIGRLLVKVSD